MVHLVELFAYPGEVLVTVGRGGSDGQDLLRVYMAMAILHVLYLVHCARDCPRGGYLCFRIGGLPAGFVCAVSVYHGTQR